MRLMLMFAALLPIATSSPVIPCCVTTAPPPPIHAPHPGPPPHLPQAPR
jgi:hypothetical protein